MVSPAASFEGHRRSAICCRIPNGIVKKHGDCHAQPGHSRQASQSPSPPPRQGRDVRRRRRRLRRSAGGRTADGRAAGAVGRSACDLRRRQWRHHPAPRFLRLGVRRPSRPCPADGVRAERRPLCQHLERPLLSERYAAGRRLPDRARGHQGRGPRRRGRAVRSGRAAGLGRRDRHRLLQRRPLRRRERQDRALSVDRRRDRAEGAAAGHRLRSAADRRPSDASFHHRSRGPSLCRPRHGDEFLSDPKPHAELARPPALHRARDPRRHLALRGQQEGSAFLPGGTLCDRAAQRRRFRLRRRGPPVGDPARPRSAAAELAETLYRAAKRPSSRRRNSSSSSAAPITAGRNAITTASRKSWCWRRSTAATAATRSASARRRPRRSPRSRRTGRRTI